MPDNEQLQLFEDQPIRTAWDEEKEEWYFSVVDVVGVLTEAKDYQAARNYWKVTQKRLKDEGNQPVTNCNRLKLKTADGKRRLTDEWQDCGVRSGRRNSQRLIIRVRPSGFYRAACLM